MKIEVEVNANDVLKEFTATKIVEHFGFHRDINDLLECMPVSSIIQFLREKYSVDMILGELAELNAIEAHIAELRAWAEKQKKEGA